MKHNTLFTGLRRWALFLLLLLEGFNSVGQQNGPLVVDEAAGQYPGSFPFDRPFDVKYISKKKVPTKYVGLFGVTREGCLADYRSKKSIVRAAKAGTTFKSAVRRKAIWDSLFQKWSLSRKELRDTFHKVWDKLPRNKDQLRQIIRQELHSIETATLYDDFSNTDSNSVQFVVPPLKPNNRYMLLFLSHRPIEGIQQVVEALSIDSIALAQRRYQAIVDATRLSLSPDDEANCSNPRNFEIAPFQDFDTFYVHQLKPDVDSIKHLQDSLKKITAATLALNKIDLDPGTIDANIRRSVITYSQQCLHCEDTIWQSEIMRKDIDIITPLLRLEQLNDTSLSYGLRDIYSDETVYDNQIKTDKRLQNLKKTTTALVQLQQVMDYYYAKYRFDSHLYQAFSGEIKDAVDLLSDNIVLVMERQKMENSLEKGIAALEQHSENQLQHCEELVLPISKLASNTFTYNFETRTGFLIKPDFGFLYYRSLNSKSSFRGFSPYLGFHINFRPLDTDIPFGTIQNEGVWGHLSFNAGALIGSFAEQGVRDGLIGNTAIFTGLGWAFTEWLRLTSGAVWYRKEEVNPLKSHKTTAAVPYISLSFDLRLRGIYETFVNIFPK